MSKKPSVHDFLDSLSIPYPSNDGTSDCRRFEGQRGVERSLITNSIMDVLTNLKEEGCDPGLVREIWTAALLQNLVVSNPYRDPLDERAVYSDWVFLQILHDRIVELLRAYGVAWSREPRSFDETGHF